MGLLGLVMACYLGLYGILSGLTKSTDHPSSSHKDPLEFHQASLQDPWRASRAQVRLRQEG